MKKMHRVERPRERLQKLGASALRDEELLAMLLGTGTAGRDVLALAKDLLRRYEGKRLLEASLDELKGRKGIGPAKACVILSAFELTRRLLGHGADRLPSVQSPREALAHLQDIRSLKKENFVVLCLNARNQLLHREVVSVGTLNSSLVHPREVFGPAIEHASAAVLLAHNHPSGDCAPSDEDVRLSKRLAGAGELLGIEVLDHLIVSPASHYSLKEHGHL